MQQLSLFGDGVEIPKERGTKAMECHICGATFYAKSKRAKYCSKECRAEAATRRRREKAAAEAEQPPRQSLNVIRFPNGADLLDAENDAELLMRIIENQQLQIENQQQLIGLLQTTLEALRNGVRHDPIREPRRVTFDDDDDLPAIDVRDDDTSSGDSGQNFLNSLMALQD